MKNFLNINIRVSNDSSGNPRFTKDEVEKLIKDEDIKFVRNLLCRISDGKVIGEIDGFKTSTKMEY